MIRRIVIPLRSDGKGENLVAHAALLARRFGAHVEALHCRPRPEDMLPYGIPVAAFLRKQILESAARVADEEEATLRSRIEAATSGTGLVWSDRPEPGRATISWREVPGKQVDVIRTHGRLADLIVVAKPDRDRNLGANTLKSALFHTGRPVVMCPPRPEPPKALGERVTIAWNGSMQAARAVAMTFDLIRAAASVTILTGGTEIHGASARDLADYLAARGVTAALQPFEAKAHAGELLLRASDALGADLMIMGAYSRSHGQETVFGGTTQEVVDGAAMPVVLVH